jgi:hypothetical protein
MSMKWEIKDEWIKQEFPKDERFPPLESSLHFFREWNDQYWYRDVYLRTSSDCMARKVKLMTKGAFNQAHDNKTFRNCRLYHGRLKKKAHYGDKYLILSRSELRCKKCNKKLDSNKTIFFGIFNKTIRRPYHWGGYDLRCYCPTCRKIEKLIE